MNDAEPAHACVYCMGPNPRRARCCCAEHERRVAAMLSSHRAGRLRQLDKLLTARRRQLTLDGRWRDVAMGRSRAEQLGRIFGVEPEVFAC